MCSTAQLCRIVALCVFVSANLAAAQESEIAAETAPDPLPESSPPADPAPIESEVEEAPATTAEEAPLPAEPMRPAVVDSDAEPTDEERQEAVRLFDQAAEHYSNGSYEHAAEALERAHQLDPQSPTLLFNLARVYELMGELDRAIEYGTLYRNSIPQEDREQRAEAEATLSRLNGARAYLNLRAQAERRSAPPLEILTERVITRERGVADLPFWITAGASAALLISGGIAGALALSSDSETRNTPALLRCNWNATPAECDAAFTSAAENQEALVNQTNRRALLSDIFLSLGATAAVGALLLYLLRFRTTVHETEQRREFTLAPFINPSRNASAFGLNFGVSL